MGTKGRRQKISRLTVDGRGGSESDFGAVGVGAVHRLDRHLIEVDGLGAEENANYWYTKKVPTIAPNSERERVDATVPSVRHSPKCSFEIMF